MYLDLEVSGSDQSFTEVPQKACKECVAMDWRLVNLPLCLGTRRIYGRASLLLDSLTKPKHNSGRKTDHLFSSPCRLAEHAITMLGLPRPASAVTFVMITKHYNVINRGGDLLLQMFTVSVKIPIHPTVTHSEEHGESWRLHHTDSFISAGPYIAIRTWPSVSLFTV